jgi:hypothetical protein
MINPKSLLLSQTLSRIATLFGLVARALPRSTLGDGRGGHMTSLCLGPYSNEEPSPFVIPLSVTPADLLPHITDNLSPLLFLPVPLHHCIDGVLLGLSEYITVLESVFKAGIETLDDLQRG